MTADKNLARPPRPVFTRRRKLLLGLPLILLGLVWVSGVRVYAFAGDSMAPLLRGGDHFVGLTGVWGRRPPQRFELVIFDVPPTSKWAGQKIPWVKRLVALPTEHVRISGPELFINGRRVPAPFLYRRPGQGAVHDFEIQLGQDEYFVLGDNLDGTLEDSRALGPIPAGLLKGRVAWVLR